VASREPKRDYRLRSLGRWEIAVLALSVFLALVLGGANLGAPSLWHDELVHVFVARDIAATGTPHLPSGNFYPNAAFFNYVLAALMTFVGDSESVVRAPSVVFAACNVVLTFLILRGLLGRATAAVGALALATCPWTVAWSREARFYALQQSLYLIMLLCLWRAYHSERPQTARWTAGACASLVLGLTTSYHSILFLAPVGAFAAIVATRERRLRSRVVAVSLVLCLVGVFASACLVVVLPQADSIAVFRDGGIGGKLAEPEFDPDRSDRMFYVHWLKDNLSVGYLLLACLGAVAMAFREKQRGLFTALAFWAPLLMLTYLIGYRRYRFMFFAFPFYVACFSYALVALARFVAAARGSWPRLFAALLVMAFGVRLTYSTLQLWGDSVEAARGSHTTLARKHPQWRGPCRYVRRHLDEKAVVATTCLPVMYYVGRCDQWYPSRHVIWEYYELGHEGLKTIDDLAAFMEVNPSGYFLADWRRFGYHPLLDEDEAWVEARMTRIDGASNDDITVYEWGGAPADHPAE
jgi:4-amino-4-deoxy-L-arabinose transferase-like glycosyltransferase